jgi:hypothetical protein
MAHAVVPLHASHAALVGLVALLAIACDPADQDPAAECKTNPTPSSPISFDSSGYGFQGECTLSSNVESEGQRSASFDCPDGTEEVKWLTVVGSVEVMPALEEGAQYTVDLVQDTDFAQINLMISDAQGPLIGLIDNVTTTSWGPLGLSFASACEAAEEPDGYDGYVLVEHGDETTAVEVGMPTSITVGELQWDVHAIRARAEADSEGPNIEVVLLRR